MTRSGDSLPIPRTEGRARIAALGWLSGKLLSVGAILFLVAGPATAVWPLPPYRIYPCDPTKYSALCYACNAYSKDEAYQVNQAERSSRSNPATPISTYGICVGFHDWCIKSPQLDTVQAQVLPGTRNGRVRIRFIVPYDLPNNYCMVQDDPVRTQCGAGIWPIQILGTAGHLTRLILESGGSEAFFAPAVFEHGLWLPTVETSCGSVASYTVKVTNLDDFPECASPYSASATVSIDLTSVTKCNPPDRRPCPGSGGASTTSGDPINVGSGDVSHTLPLFVLGQSPLSLPIVLSYHSGTPLYPSLVSSPIADGWTHSFAQTLRPADPFGLTLYHLTADGFESEYEIQEDGSWAASNPGDLRGTVTRDGASNRFLLKDLDGTITAFDVTSGLWLSTTDRWGNSITGTYTGGTLTAVTDSMGRQVVFSYSSGRLTQVTAPDGQAWRFAYSGSQLARVFDPIHAGSTPWRTFGYQPDHSGAVRLLSEVRDESGALLEGHTYDAVDRGITSVSEAGDLVTVEYDTPAPGQTRVTHNIDATTDQVSVFTLFYQNGRWLPSRIDGNCASCGGAGFDSQILTYDGSDNVLTRTDGNGHVTSYQYDANANVLSRTDARGTAKERTTTYRYGYAPWPTFRTEIHEPSAARPGAEAVTQMAWNTVGAPETTLTLSRSGYIQSSDASPTPYTAVTTFDARHRLLSEDGPRTEVADVTTNTYYADNDPIGNRRGRLRQTTDPATLATTYDDYDVFGTARSITDPNGVVTIKATDDRGRLIASTIKAVPGDPDEPADYTSSYIFDGRDRLTEVTLPRGNRLRYTFEDGTNRQTDTIRIDLSGNEVERRHLTLNVIGDREREEDQLCDTPAPICASWTTKASESFAYDVHNRLVRIDHSVPSGAKTIYGYDPDGLLLAVQDENHSQANTRYAYDALDRLVAVTQTLGGAPGGAAVTTYSYNVMDKLASVTDPNGNVTIYSHDDFGRLQSQSSPISGMTAYSYDPTGNPISSVDADGATTTRTYDADGRNLTSSSTRAGLPTESITWAYDDPTPSHYGKGRLASMTDPSGSTSYAYERRGLLKSENRSILGDAYTTAYRYDANGNRAGMTYPSGRQLAYGFDLADRPQSLAGTFNLVSTTYIGQASYLPFGPEETLTYLSGAGSLTRSGVHDSRYRLTELNVSQGAVPLADYRYGLDAAGNVTAINDSLNPQFDRAFAYDDLYRIVGADTGSGLWGPGRYTYDPLGNRLMTTLGQNTASYNYETVNSQTTGRLSSVIEDGSARAVTIDAVGNETGVGSTNFTYSARNFLDQGDGLHYVYDGSGVRVAQVGLSLGPIIAQQPASGPVCPGASATLTVRAPGATGYQWQVLNGGTWTDVAGATGPSLSVTPTAVTSYRCVVSNAASSTTSAVATLTPVALGTEPTSGGFYGDLNRDGAVDATDVFLMKEVLAGNLIIGTPPVTASPKAVDLNGDAKIDSLDLSLLSTYAAGGIHCLPQIPSGSGSGALSRASVRPQQAEPNPTQYFFYSPELSLLEETELKAGGGRPDPAIDYIWFGGHPVAQENIAESSTRLTFDDHLGAPFLQTDPAGTVLWRLEAEPFGAPFLMRAGLASDQRLRFPGQEFDEQAPERDYNVFRWYRPAWGRYTQDDPISRSAVSSLFNQRNRLGSPGAPWSRIGEGYPYAGSRPTMLADPSGLCTKCDECPSGEWTYFGGGSSVYFAVGVSASFGTYTCVGDPFHPKPPRKLRVRTLCFIYGAIVGVRLPLPASPEISRSFGLSASTPYGAACGCNASDLLGTTNGSTAAIGPVTVDINPCAGIGRATSTNIGGSSLGAGFAFTRCNTIPDWWGLGW